MFATAPLPVGGREIDVDRVLTSVLQGPTDFRLLTRALRARSDLTRCCTTRCRRATAGPPALGREMATLISPRAGFTQHTTTLAAAAEMVHPVVRAQDFQDCVEGGLLS